MNLGSHFVIMVASVTLARFVLWFILKCRSSEDSESIFTEILTDSAKSQGTVHLLLLKSRSPKAGGAPRLFQERLMHYEEEDSRQLYVVMSKTHCHLKLPGRLRRQGHDVFQQYLWHLYIGIFFVEAIAGIWMLYVLLVRSSS